VLAHQAAERAHVASSSSVDRAGDSVRRSADTEPNGNNRAEGGMLSTSR